MPSDKIKRIPYGVSDFEKLKSEDLYYIDKTPFIQILESIGYYLFLIRPRRFGKSLLLSMLESYYDIAKKDQFEEIFRDTVIKDNPTEERNSYLILKLNFSKEQLLKYEQDEIVQKTKGDTNLRKLILVFKGWELVVKDEI